jgi:hypothetical protein
MPALRNITFWLVSITYPLAILWWTSWSRFHRLFTQQDGTKLLDRLTPEHAQHFMNLVDWRPDTWFEFGDVCASPLRFQRNVDARIKGRAQLVQSCDCDDFAGWAAYVVDPTFHPRIMAVAYQKRGSAAPNGHVVCLVDCPEGLLHIGNWGKSPPFRTGDIAAAAFDIARRADARLISYAVLDKDLHILFTKRV